MCTIGVAPITHIRTCVIKIVTFKEGHQRVKVTSWSPAGKGLTSWLSFVVSSVSLSLSHWYPGSGVVLDCIDS